MEEGHRTGFLLSWSGHKGNELSYCTWRVPSQGYSLHSRICAGQGNKAEIICIVTMEQPPAFQVFLHPSGHRTGPRARVICPFHLVRLTTAQSRWVELVWMGAPEYVKNSPVLGLRFGIEELGIGGKGSLVSMWSRVYPHP